MDYDLIKQSQKLYELMQELVAKLAETPVEAAATHGAHVDYFSFAITVFVLACFIGYYVVWKVTPALHTPLMSLTNAVSSIIIVGGIAAAGAKTLELSSLVGFFAIFFAAINLFGGFMITKRMLDMFQKKK